MLRGYVPMREVSNHFNAQPLSARHCPASQHQQQEAVLASRGPSTGAPTSRSASAATATNSADSSSSAAGYAPQRGSVPTAAATSTTASTAMTMESPRADARHRGVAPQYVPELAQEIVEMYLRREQTQPRNANYLAAQTEVHEKMRTILLDWFIDVGLKFRLHPETFFLAVDIVDRYLALTNVPRSQLQLVGITAVLIAAKYEEMWAMTVQECVSITANTYTKDEVLRMERTVLAALQFKLTVPTPFPLMARLLDVCQADEPLRHAANYYLEHAALSYKHLQFLPSQVANASVFLANLTLQREGWTPVLHYYSRSTPAEFRDCARLLLEFTVLLSTSKYQAIRRKYSNPRYSDIARMSHPEMPAI